MKIKEEPIEELRVPRYIPQEVKIVLGIMPAAIFVLWLVSKLLSR